MMFGGYQGKLDDFKSTVSTFLENLVKQQKKSDLISTSQRQSNLRRPKQDLRSQHIGEVISPYWREVMQNL